MFLKTWRAYKGFNLDVHRLEKLDKEDLFVILQNCLNEWPTQLHTRGSKKKAAVLLIIHNAQTTPHILLTKRNSELKFHKGEISFPGGASLKHDHSLCATAIRETREEIGVNIEEGDIIGCLKSVRTLTSNFSILPFVTIQDRFIQPQAFIGEVECIIDAPLFDLLLTLKVDLKHRKMSQKRLYNFTYNNHIIWGATATILKQLRDCFSHQNV